MLYSTIIAEKWSVPEVLDRISEYDIYAKYLGGNFKIGKPFNSPLREDKNPSFSIYTAKNGQLRWHDFATGENGNVFEFVRAKLNLKDIIEVLENISRDFALNKTYPPPKLPPRPRFKTKDITVTRKPFNQAELKYWQRYGISEATLKEYNVSALSAFFINGLQQTSIKKEHFMFGWKVYNKFKIYRPFQTREEKWRSSLSVYDVQGFEQLNPEGNLLIITKALKDVMLLRELGYDAIAPPSETSTIPAIIMNNLRTRFKRIVVFYDNDKAGQKGAKAIVDEYGLDNIIIPAGEPKDISDYYADYDKEKTVELLARLLK